jgi:hypothetical protein
MVTEDKSGQVVAGSDPQHLDPNPLNAGASASTEPRPQGDDSTLFFDIRNNILSGLGSDRTKLG